MEIKNKTNSMIGIIFTDPSFKKVCLFFIIQIFFGIVSIFKLYYLDDSKKKLELISKDEKIKEYIILFILIALTSFSFLRKQKIGGTANDVLRNGEKIKGKIVLVTGGYKGIGLAFVKEVLKFECEVILACRSLTYMECVKKDLLNDYSDAKIHCMELDLGNYESIEKFANNLKQEFSKIDIIVNNAGFIKKEIEYIDGIESTFFINYLGHFYLIKLLYNLILSSNTFVINVSSIAHALMKESHVNFHYIYENKSNNVPNNIILYRKEYNMSKLCMLYFTQELQKRFEKEKTEACTVSINPGLVRTSLFRYETNILKILIRYLCFSKSPSEGCQTILYLCLLDRDKIVKGNYYSDCKLEYIRSYAKDEKKAEELWNISEKILSKRKK